jgi:hypothetical protein
MEIYCQADSKRSFSTNVNPKSLFGIFKSNALKIITFTLSTLLTVLVISIGLVISTELTGYNEYNINNPVDKKSCKCSCWDGFYRGVHGRESHDTLYKAFYFNYDKQLIAILFGFLFYAQCLKEILVKLIKSFIQIFYSNEYSSKNIRFGVLINLIISAYSNFYGIWIILNYLNDRDYRMIRSQMFFSLTELIPSYLFFQYLNKFDLDTKAFKPVSLSIVYPILFISCLHIYLASFEKILWGFFTSNHGDANRNKLRDILLILNDISAILFSIHSLCKTNRGYVSQSLTSVSSVKNLKIGHGHLHYIKYWFIITIILYIFYYLFCSF